MQNIVGMADIDSAVHQQHGRNGGLVPQAPQNGLPIFPGKKKKKKEKKKKKRTVNPRELSSPGIFKPISIPQEITHHS